MASPAPRREHLTVAKLRANKFKYTGIWTFGDDKHTHCDTTNIPERPVVYAFVFENEAYYIGRSIKNMRARIRSYNRSQRKGAVSRYVHCKLRSAFERDDRARVTVYTKVVEPYGIDADGMPFDFVSGLELGLINKYRPRWNLERFDDEL